LIPLSFSNSWILSKDKGGLNKYLCLAAPNWEKLESVFFSSFNFSLILSNCVIVKVVVFAPAKLQKIIITTVDCQIHSSTVTKLGVVRRPCHSVIVKRNNNRNMVTVFNPKIIVANFYGLKFFRYV